MVFACVSWRADASCPDSRSSAFYRSNAPFTLSHLRSHLEFSDFQRKYQTMRFLSNKIIHPTHTYTHVIV